MKRKSVAFLLAFLFVMSICPLTLAHDDQKEHDADLKYAFFGDRDKFLQGDEKKAFTVIANAAALAIDQYSPNDKAQWKQKCYDTIQKYLCDLKVPELNISYEELDLNIHVSSDKKNVTGTTHRKYTHLGWNYKEYPNQDFWMLRKKVLLDSVNRVLFNPQSLLSWWPWLSDVFYGPSEQCDAFCGMIYYIHILGDHIAGNTPNKLTDLEPLIQYASLSTPGIIAELKEQIQIVFVSQKNSWTYLSLMEDLSTLEICAEKNCGTWGSIDTDEKCRINQKNAEKLLDILAKRLPQMLKNEPFFSDRFKS